MSYLAPSRVKAEITKVLALEIESGNHFHTETFLRKTETTKMFFNSMWTKTNTYLQHKGTKFKLHCENTFREQAKRFDNLDILSDSYVVLKPIFLVLKFHSEFRIG